MPSILWRFAFVGAYFPVCRAMAAALFAASLAFAAIDDELSTLGKRHGTDKVKHGFTKLYNARFSPLRSSVRHVLEGLAYSLVPACVCGRTSSHTRRSLD